MRRVLILGDKKAGHESISKGVVENLKEFIDIEVIYLHVKLRSSIFKLFLKYFLNIKSLNKLINKKFIKFFYSFDDIDFENINLIISTGGKTSFANVMFSKLYSIKNIYCSSLRGLRYELFTFIVTINPKDNFPNALKFDIAPIRMRLDKKRAKTFAKNIKLEPKEKIYSLLLGGVTKEYMFDTQEIISIVDSLIKKAKEDRAKLLISTSRRTPKEVDEYIENLKIDNTLVYKVIYNKNPEKVVNVYLTLSETVFITEDSGSMITESILAKKPTVTIKSKLNNPQKIYKMFIENCKKKRYILSLETDKITDINLSSLNLTNYDDTKNRENFIKITNILKE